MILAMYKQGKNVYKQEIIRKMNWVTFALIGLTAVTVTIAVFAVTQANKKSDELKTQESSGAVLTNGYTVHDLSETSTLSNFESNGVQIARNGLVHFSAAENLTTGYGWILEENGGECGGIVSVNESYDAPHFDDEELAPVGVGGTKYFTIGG